MVIDSHVHIVCVPEDKEGNRDLFTNQCPDDKMLEAAYNKTLASLQKSMKEARIDHSFIMPDRKKAKQLSIDMEHAVRLTADMPNVHVIGTADIATYVKDDLDRLDELMSQAKIHGIKLYTGYQPFYPSDTRCHPFYKLCLKYDLPVIFHTGDTANMDFPVKVKYAHPLNIDDLAADFPDLKIIMAHLGNPWLTDAAEVLYKNPNVYADLSGLFWTDSFDSTYAKMLRQKIQEVILYAGASRLIYGSDWPVGDLKVYLKFIQSLKIPKKDRDAVFFQNAAKLFKV